MAFRQNSGGSSHRTPWVKVGITIVLTTLLVLYEFAEDIPWLDKLPHNIILSRGVGAGGASSSSSDQTKQEHHKTSRHKSSTLTWADTPSGQVCHAMLPWSHGGQYASFSFAWNELRPDILNASYFGYFPFHYEELDRFRDWISDIFDFYTIDRLRRSQAHPAPTASIRKILQLIQKRVDDPVTNGPIQIIVMGGSVTTGNHCSQNPLDLPGTENTRIALEGCSYPERLHHLLNKVLFSRQDHDYPIFEVANLGVPSTNSEVGAMVLEYELLPQMPDKLPHIVISSYSANDAHDPDRQETFHTHQQNFIRAAHSLRPCDDDLPLIVLADDLYGPNNYLERALEQTGSLYKTASWHNVMAIVYSNVVRHEAVANFNASEINPLFGSPFVLHMGMGFHIAVAWTMLFNLLGAMHQACSDVVPTIATEMEDPQRIWTFVEPPTKYRGQIAPKAEAVAQEWKKNLAVKESRCQMSQSIAEERSSHVNRPLYSTDNCAYAWMVSPATSVNLPEHVTAAVTYVMTENHGWEASGMIPTRVHTQPLTAWFTNKTHSRFAIELYNITMDIDSFTVLSMKSYGPDWIDSKLRVSITVTPHDSSSGGSSTAMEQYEIDGYHTTLTSVYFPHKFRLPGKLGGAKLGDSIRAVFSLIRGRSFKIAGLAFCQSYYTR